MLLISSWFSLKGHTFLKQTCSLKLQVYLSMYDALWIPVSKRLTLQRLVLLGRVIHTLIKVLQQML